MKSIFTLLLAIFSVGQIFAQQAIYDVTSGNGNGLRFWSSDNYKIHMGNASENKYGPVTDFSIKMNMSANAGRGWTWGQVGATPIAALSNVGHMQIAGNFTSMANGVFNGKLAVGISDPGSYTLNVNGNSYFSGHQTFQSVAHDGLTSATHLYFPLKGDGFNIMTQQLSVDNSEVIFRMRDNITGDAIRFWFDDWRGEDFDRNPLIVYGDRVLLASDGGNVGIGLTNPSEKLVVDGKIIAEEVKVQNVPNSDYVFEPDYPLLPLSEVETHIKEKKHLPGIPSAEQFKENGVGLGEMDDMLLRKVEELMLYVIEQEKRMMNLEKENEEQATKLENLEKENVELRKILSDPVQLSSEPGQRSDFGK